ncbi:MAG: VanZ family protein [Clostridiales bacterium]|jgi:glycopeptide antibiotics resistance protein|nr:VanZ family protein [Clostridiales bacterium]
MIHFYFYQLLPIFPIALVTTAIVYFCIYKLLRSRRPKPARTKALSEFVLIGWSVVYLYVTQLMSFGHGSWETMNLRPFQSFITAIKYGSVGMFWQIILNILMCAPLGFLLPTVFSKRCRNFFSVLALSFGAAFFTELTQLLTGRSADIDDVIANTLGGLLGFALYGIARRIWK